MNDHELHPIALTAIGLAMAPWIGLTIWTSDCAAAFASQAGAQVYDLTAERMKRILS